MSNLPPGCTQDEIDRWLEGEQCDVCGGDAAHCKCYGDTLENSCPECGRRLVEELDGGFTCPQCDAKEEPPHD